MPAKKKSLDPNMLDINEEDMESNLSVSSCSSSDSWKDEPGSALSESQNVQNFVK